MPTVVRVREPYPRTTDQLAENLDAATMDLEDEVLDRLAAVAPPGY